MKLVLVEDHLSYRQSLRLALSTFDSFEVTGEADRARDAFQVIESAVPDLVVVDFMLPDSDAVSLARELRRRRMKPRMMILARLGHPLFVRDALRAGVGGYALKRESLQSLMDAMKQVASGETYLSPELRDLPPADSNDGDAARLEQLSQREREIFCLLMEGMATKEIAKVLYLSPKTIDAHRLHINRKLGVRSPAALARLVAEQGLIRV